LFAWSHEPSHSEAGLKTKCISPLIPAIAFDRKVELKGGMPVQLDREAGKAGDRDAL
jgi:hypothetical protein